MEWLLLVFFLERAAAPMEIAFPSQDLCRMAAWQLRIDWATQLQDKGAVEDARPSDAPVIVSCIRTSGEARKSDGLGYNYLLLEKGERATATKNAGDDAPVRRRGERPPLPDNSDLRRSTDE